MKNNKLSKSQFYKNFDCLIMKYTIINIPTTENIKIGKLDSILNLVLTSSPNRYAVYIIIAI